MNIDRRQPGAAIARLRRMRGLSQRDCADRAGISVTFLSLLENGRKQASVDTLNALAEALDVPTAIMLALGSKSPGRKATPEAKLLKSLQKAIEELINAESALVEQRSTARAG